jgi:hypothetical protein
VRSRFRSALQWAAAGAGLAAGAYAAYVGITWSRYGQPASRLREENDPLLDRFMPVYEVSERHHARVAAPAALTLAAAKDMGLMQMPAVRAIFKARELILGAEPEDRRLPRGLLAEVLALGWVVLAEVSDREVVVGSVTKPWESNVTFRPCPAEGFAAFAEPDYVKIAWTLRADPHGETESTFRTETRVVSTDAGARRKFRRYWSFLSPGIILIRWLSLGPLKAEAERRARSAREDARA